MCDDILDILGVPAFFWLKDLEAEEVKQILLEAVVINTDIYEKATIVQTGAFLGKGFHSKLIEKSGKVRERLSLRTLGKTIKSPREFFSPIQIKPMERSFKGESSSFNKYLEDELTRLSIIFFNSGDDYYDKEKARAIDCHLYARDDKYTSKVRQE